jgi:histidyl-tRNA synthetase
MGELIEPRVLKGFRDFLPAREAERLDIIARLQEVFHLFGFSPIDTPVLEYAEVLLGKGGGETDKQVYRFTDHGGRDVALRYDLTVPFARFMAAHLAEVPVPFKRWHAAKVWRGENTQRGRYREFVQVDFDIVGADSAAADLEILLLMRETVRAVGGSRFAVHFAHRGVFNAFLSRIGAGAHAVEILRAMDKERKVGREKTREALAAVAGEANADAVLEYSRVGGSLGETLERLGEAAGPGCEGVQRLRAIVAGLTKMGIADSFVLDPSITRGLDYYTGIVFETFLADLPAIGSICSGGRYNDLASLYTKQKLPGVGASIGLDRLMAAREELGLAPAGPSAAGVVVTLADDGQLGTCQRIAAAFRAAGIPAEVYPETKKLAVQYAWAEKKGIALAVLAGGGQAGGQQAGGDLVGLRDLRTRQDEPGLTLESAIGRAKELLR